MPLPVREPLLALVDNLEQALEAKLTGREQQWVVGVERALAAVEAALPEHSADLETQDGLFSTLSDPDKNSSPGFRKIRKLRQEHSDFLWWVHGLQKSLKGLRNRMRLPPESKERQVHLRLETLNGVNVKLRDIRHRARYLVIRLKRHREAETKLLLESLTTEIGGGD
jgi:hypothetical protein